MRGCVAGSRRLLVAREGSRTGTRASDRCRRRSTVEGRPAGWGTAEVKAEMSARSAARWTYKTTGRDLLTKRPLVSTAGALPRPRLARSREIVAPYARKESRKVSRKARKEQGTRKGLYDAVDEGANHTAATDATAMSTARRRARGERTRDLSRRAGGWGRGARLPLAMADGFRKHGCQFGMER